MNARNQTVFVLTLALSLIAPPVAYAQKKHPPKEPLPLDGTARISDQFGQVGKKMVGASDFTPLPTGSILMSRTTVRTGEDAAALVALPGGHHLRIGGKSVVVLEELGGKRLSFKLLSGQAWVAMRDPRTACEVQTPSSITRVPVPRANEAPAPALFGVGYELESDQSMVSVAEGRTTVSPRGVGWKAAVKAGQYVRYLRKPQPNIRLRTPELLAHDGAQKTMWELLRQENWTKHTAAGNNGAKLKRGQEKRLRQLTFSVSVEP